MAIHALTDSPSPGRQRNSWPIEDEQWETEVATPLIHPRGVTNTANANIGRVLEYRRLTADIGFRPLTLSPDVVGIIAGPGFFWTWTPTISQHAFDRDPSYTFDRWEVAANVNIGRDWHRYMMLTAHQLARGVDHPLTASLVALAWLLPPPAMMAAADDNVCVTEFARRMVVPECAARVRFHSLFDRVCPKLRCGRHTVTHLSLVE